MTPLIDELTGSKAERLGGDLRAIQLWRDIGATSIDRVVLARASAHCALIREGAHARRRLRWSQFAAAAGLGLAAVVATWVGAPRQSPVNLAADITRDGSVDILDAFALARRIDSGGDLPAEFDLDGDGRVDQRDIDAIVATVVAIDAKETAGATAAADSGWRPQS